MALQPTAENFRAELSRHMVDRRLVYEAIGMHRNLFSAYVTGLKPLMGWSAHNIGWGINTVVGRYLFDVDMTRGVLTPKRGRPRGWRAARRHSQEIAALS